MGDKSGGAPPPAAATKPAGIDPAMMQMMQMMMQQQSAMSQQRPQAPTAAPTPTAQTVEKVDWTKKLEDLTEQTTAGYNTEQAKRVGRTESIRTPSLLDEEETLTTSTELGA